MRFETFDMGIGRTNYHVFDIMVCQGQSKGVVSKVTQVLIGPLVNERFGLGQRIVVAVFRKDDGTVIGTSQNHCSACTRTKVKAGNAFERVDVGIG
jgi:hypothetical protein